MSTKSSQLQIRVSPAEKTRLKALAMRSGLDVSRYVLERVLPTQSIRFHDILHSLRDDETHRFGLAALNDFLSELGATEFVSAVESADPTVLSPFVANYVCALVEQAAQLYSLPPPVWTNAVDRLSEPYFATPLISLRPRLLRASPVPFRRRQLFVDSPLGDRVTGSARPTRGHIFELFDGLNEELAEVDTIGELYRVGGAVMCLALNARESTADVDALFEPTQTVREAAVRVGAAAGVGDRWLNDAVKGFLSPRGDLDPFLELSHLRVFVAHPEYLLAMKCAAMRLGAESHDLDDVRYLLRWLNITRMDEALVIVTRYFDQERLPRKTRLALEEMLG